MSISLLGVRLVLSRVIWAGLTTVKPCDFLAETVACYIPKRMQLC